MTNLLTYQNQWTSLAEASRLSGLSCGAIKTLIRRGEVLGYRQRNGRAVWRVEKQSLDEYIKALVDETKEPVVSMRLGNVKGSIQR